VSDLANRK